MTGQHHQQAGQMRPDRVEAMLARYQVGYDETGWDRRTKSHPERIHKNIRMRVRYTCHNCSTTFGRDRICAECHHQRCTRCSRYPPRRDRPKVLQDAPTDPPPQTQNEVSRPSVEVGICHECQTGFEIPVEECPNCHHTICDRCIHQASITVEPGQDIPSQPTQTAATGISPRQSTIPRGESTAPS